MKKKLSIVLALLLVISGINFNAFVVKADDTDKVWIRFKTETGALVTKRFYKHGDELKFPNEPTSTDGRVFNGYSYEGDKKILEGQTVEKRIFGDNRVKFQIMYTGLDNDLRDAFRVPNGSTIDVYQNWKDPEPHVNIEWNYNDSWDDDEYGRGERIDKQKNVTIGNKLDKHTSPYSDLEIQSWIIAEGEGKGLRPDFNRPIIYRKSDQSLGIPALRPNNQLDYAAYKDGEVVKFKPIYNLKTLKLEFLDEAGNTINTQYIGPDDIIEKVEAPQKPGYKLNFWDLVDDGDRIIVDDNIFNKKIEVTYSGGIKYKIPYIDYESHNREEKVLLAPAHTTLKHKPVYIKVNNQNQDNQNDQNQGGQDQNAEKISITYYEDGQEYRHEELSPGEFLLLGWNPEPFGKEFDYWKTENGKKLEGDVKVDRHDTLGWVLATRSGDFITNVSGDSLRINAVWKEGVGIPRHKVSFDTDGGNVISPVEVESGQALEAPVNPVKEGYTFKHWAINGKKFNFSWLITHDITLKAIWEKNPAGTFKVTFDAKGGSPVPDVQHVVKGKKAKKPTVKPSKAGFEFVDWYTSEGKYNFNKKVEREMTIFAKYKKANAPEEESTKCKRQELNIPDADYDKAILQYKKPFFEGNPDGTFKPEGTIKRAEMATVFARVLGLEGKNPAGSKQFSDIANHWAKNNIQLVAEYGLLDGYPDGSFRPEGNMTRAEICAIISKYWQKKNFVANTEAADIKDINSHWSKDMVLGLYNHGFVDLKNKKFRPDEALTRADVAKILNRLVDRPLIDEQPLYVDVPTSHRAYKEINTASSQAK